MKEFWSETCRLLLCIVRETIGISVLALPLSSPIVLTAVTDNPWWLLLYVPSFGILFGIKTWMDE